MLISPHTAGWLLLKFVLVRTYPGPSGKNWSKSTGTWPLRSIVMEDLVASFSEFKRKARARLSVERAAASPPRKRCPMPASRLGPASAPTAKRPTITTASAPSSGRESRRPERRRPRSPPRRPAASHPTTSSAGPTPGSSSRGTHQERPSDRWQHQLSTWAEVAEKYGISDHRYDDFSYLTYLDLTCPFVDNYAKAHLGTDSPIIKGRLAKHANFWNTLRTPDWLKEVIESGFTVPFQKLPPKIFLQNNRSVLEQSKIEWVRNTLVEYEQLGFIRRTTEIPHCVSPLQIKDTGNKTALIFDMSVVNDYVEKSKFKMEGWEDMFSYSQIAVAGIKFDIKKYFYCIDINKDFQKYFGFMFCLREGEEPTSFVWTVLPYGYTRAPFLARELMKPLILKWRNLGINIVVYCDDGMAVSHDLKFLESAAKQVQCDLLRAGLVPGVEKYVWLPQTNLDWLGISFNFSLKGISITTRRIDETVAVIEHAIQNWPNISFRNLSRALGKLLSLHPVFNGKEQLYSRMIQTIINIRHYKNLGWDTPLKVDYPPILDFAYRELVRWLRLLRSGNFRPFHDKLPTYVGWTDASDVAIAGFLVKLNQDERSIPYCVDSILNSAGLASRVVDRCVAYHANMLPRTVQTQLYEVSDLLVQHSEFEKTYIVHRRLTVSETSTDSNERELLAAVELIDSCRSLLANRKILIHFDNANAASICCKGSPKPRLHSHAMQIQDICETYNIELATSWLPRDLNKVADVLSKTLDFEDYSVTESFFQTVCLSAPFIPQVDCFANERNKKLPVFFSNTFSPHTAGVDCFRFNWLKYGVAWLFPPPRLILKAYLHLKNCCAKGLLLTPQWRNRSFYPLLENTPNKYLINKMIFSGTGIFRTGSDADSFFGPSFIGNVVVWCLDFTANH